MNKKASGHGLLVYEDDWAEIFFFIVLVLGILLGVLSPNAFVTYLIAFAAGMIAGRLFFDRRHKGRAAYTLIIIGFIMGYVIGTFRGDRKITFLVFLFSAVLSYYLYDRKILKDIIY